MNKNEFEAKLIIDTGEDNPETISSLLNTLQPTEVLLKGKQFYSPFSKTLIPGKVNERNLWIFSTGKTQASENLTIVSSLKRILEVISSESEKMQKLVQKYPKAYIGCYGYYYDYHEFFRLESDMIQELGNYNLSVVFDIYNLSAQEKN